MNNHPPQFQCGYDGETDYIWQGKRWTCRHYQARTEKNPNNKLVGTIRGRVGNNHDFPPAELMAHFPGYVGARYAPTGDTYIMETTTGGITVNRCVWEYAAEPRQTVDHRGNLIATAWFEQLEAYEAKRLSLATA